MLKPRLALGTPVSPSAVKVLLLGGGELGKEVAIEAQRLGCEVVVVDRYDWAPAMHVAHRRYVVNMMDGEAIKAIIRREKPDAVIPEIEAINTEALKELEEEGFFVAPCADAVRIAMDRIALRKLAAEEVGVPTTKYAFASNPDEAVDAVMKVGFPCILKPQMSSGGHGHVLLREPVNEQRIREAYEESIRGARGESKWIIVEEYVPLDTELTVLTYRAFSDETGKIETVTLPPVEHQRYGKYHYVESWQPATVPESVAEESMEIARKVVEKLGGLGIFGVEILVTRGKPLFSEVSPRPHDTGMVTMASMELSEFAIHARAVIGLPVPKPRLLTSAASYAVYAEEPGVWAPRFQNIFKALSMPGVDVRIFGKPVTYRERRMAVVLARAPSVEEARRKAREAAKLLEEGISKP